MSYPNGLYQKIFQTRCRIIDQPASEKGIVTEDANYIFTAVTSHLATKVPALKQVTHDVFEEVGKDHSKSFEVPLDILI